MILNNVLNKFYNRIVIRLKSKFLKIHLLRMIVNKMEIKKEKNNFNGNKVILNLVLLILRM
jgi:hypothetical protein